MSRQQQEMYLNVDGGIISLETEEDLARYMQERNKHK